MEQELSPRTIRFNRWIAGLCGASFIVFLGRRGDYWGLAFATLLFLWVALRLPPQDLRWPKAARRVVEVVFVLFALAAIVATIRQ